MSTSSDTVPSHPHARSVLIVDDYGPFRGVLRQIISRLGGAYAICGEAASAAEALELARAQPPDLAIVDLNLKTANGLDLTKSLLAQSPGTAVLIISLHAENLHAESALRAGARGYLMKDELLEKTALALELIARGEFYLSDYVRKHVLPRLPELDLNPVVRLPKQNGDAGGG